MANILENIMNTYATPVKTDLSKKMIIGLTGEMRSGKSTTAALFKDQCRLKGINISVMSFGTAIKKEVSDKYDFPIEYCYDDQKSVREITFLMSEDDECLPPHAEKIEYNTYKISLRKLLQWYSTEYRRAQDPLYWIKKTLNTVKFEFIGTDIIMFDDVRDDKEVEFIRTFPNNLLCKLNKYKSKYDKVDETEAAHKTETALQEFKVDHTYSPRFGKFYLTLVAKRILALKKIRDFLVFK